MNGTTMKKPTFVINRPAITTEEGLAPRRSQSTPDFRALAGPDADSGVTVAAGQRCLGGCGSGGW
jgi:hypothetical protein